MQSQVLTVVKSIIVTRGSASRHRDQFAHIGKTINVSFEEFKRKDTFFVRELLSQKGLDKL